MTPPIERTDPPTAGRDAMSGGQADIGRGAGPDAGYAKMKNILDIIVKRGETDGDTLSTTLIRRQRMPDAIALATGRARHSCWGS